MAVLHGETGKFPKQRAETQFSILLALYGLVTTLTGISAGMGIAWRNTWFAIPVMLTGFLVAFLIASMLKKPLRSLAKDRIKHWRGAQTEAFVAWILKSELDDKWHLFNGFKLQQGWDIDHVLVGPGGVFSISTKSARGYFAVAPDGTLSVNNKPADFARQAMNQALDFRRRLEALMGRDTPFVQPILAVPFAFVDSAEMNPKVWILHQENLSDTFESRQKPARLSKDQLRRAIEATKTLFDNAERLYAPPPKAPPANTNPESLSSG